MKLAEILVEGLSPVLYHATAINSIIQMVKSGTIRLSQLHTGDGYYMSFARSRTGEFTKYLSTLDDDDLEDENFHPGRVYGVLEMDGTALAQNLKGKSFNTFHDPNDPELPADFDFMEDRIISRKPEIPFRKRFLRAIHIILNNDPRSEKVLNIADKLEGNGIRVFVYEDTESFQGMGAITR